MVFPESRLPTHGALGSLPAGEPSALKPTTGSGKVPSGKELAIRAWRQAGFPLLLAFLRVGGVWGNPKAGTQTPDEQHTDERSGETFWLIPGKDFQDTFPPKMREAGYFQGKGG